MGIDACFDNEIEILDQQLEEGTITRQEYDKAVRELERDMRDYQALRINAKSMPQKPNTFAATAFDKVK